MGLRIGIDAGGTFTDAVLLDADRRVLAWAKAPTRADRALGVAEAVDRVLAGGGVDGSAVELVSLSTTLATNALVEGTGGPVALVFIGFSEAELDRGGLRDALAGGPVILADGGHDPLGVERCPVDLDAVVAAARDLEVDAFAVTAQFGVRNPAHELAVREALAPLGKPVTCGHELSAALDGPRRALTCVLNAGLTGLIADLCRATRSVLDERAIAAPLLIVRGDGSLMSAEVATERPIETILSGPAASLIGAAHLVGRPDVVVADIGGTTTDIGLLRGGRPVVAATGATVGGHRTMVEAVAVATTGLGGDSEVGLDIRSSPARLTVGPRRVVPLAMLAIDEPDLVGRTLEAIDEPHRPDDLLFVRPAANGARGPVGEREQRLLDRLDGWRPLAAVAGSRLERSVLDGLVARGAVTLAGFTATDAAHVLGLHDGGDRTASARAATILAGASDGAGRPVRPDGEALARWVVDTVIRRSAEAVLDVTLQADGFPPGSATDPLLRAAIDRRLPSDTTPGPRATELAIGPSVPLVGLGAGAATYHPGAAHLLGVDGLVPEHAPVAGAVGAAIGGIRVTARATISQPSRGQYRVHLPDAGPDRGDVDPAVERAVELLSAQVTARADRAGAESVDLTVDVERRTAEVGGRVTLVEATVTVTGIGPPRVR